MIGKRCILIAGPTASGKSAAGLRLARGLGGVIVNADSMQVYGEMRILTARPTPEEESALPHRLYGHVSVRQSYSVARWLEDVREVLREIDRMGKRAIFVGGTGLYFNALTKGLSPVPQIDAQVREYWRGEAQRRPAGELFAELQSRDPLTAGGLRESDPQRIVRALEVIQSTGRPLAEWQCETGEPLLAPGSWRGIVIAPSRQDVYRQAEARFDEMVKAGALKEVERLRDMQLDPGLPPMRALGVGPLMDFLNGGLPFLEAVERSKAQTRNYVKRQMTWLRRYMFSWKWLCN